MTKKKQLEKKRAQIHKLFLFQVRGTHQVRAWNFQMNSNLWNGLSPINRPCLVGVVSLFIFWIRCQKLLDPITPSNAQNKELFKKCHQLLRLGGLLVLEAFLEKLAIETIAITAFMRSYWSWGCFYFSWNVVFWVFFFFLNCCSWKLLGDQTRNKRLPTPLRRDSKMDSFDFGRHNLGISIRKNTKSMHLHRKVWILRMFKKRCRSSFCFIISRCWIAQCFGSTNLPPTQVHCHKWRFRRGFDFSDCFFLATLWIRISSSCVTLQAAIEQISLNCVTIKCYRMIWRWLLPFEIGSLEGLYWSFQGETTNCVWLSAFSSSQTPSRVASMVQSCLNRISWIQSIVKAGVNLLNINFKYSNVAFLSFQSTLSNLL